MGNLRTHPDDIEPRFYAIKNIRAKRGINEQIKPVRNFGIFFIRVQSSGSGKFAADPLIWYKRSAAWRRGIKFLSN